MQSAQESLAELRAAIRYAENAISAAESTIESMDFRQQLAKQKSSKREQELEEQNNHLHKEVTRLENENTKFREHKERLTGLEIQLRDKIRELKEGKEVMPVIPKDVAIAIFREGQSHGYNNESVTESLKGLCKEKGFECRIHGVDDNE